MAFSSSNGIVILGGYCVRDSKLTRDFFSTVSLWKLINIIYRRKTFKWNWLFFCKKFLARLFGDYEPINHPWFETFWVPIIVLRASLIFAKRKLFYGKSNLVQGCKGVFWNWRTSGKEHCVVIPISLAFGQLLGSSFVVANQFPLFLNSYDTKRVFNNSTFTLSPLRHAQDKAEVLFAMNDIFPGPHPFWPPGGVVLHSRRGGCYKSCKQWGELSRCNMPWFWTLRLLHKILTFVKREIDMYSIGSISYIHWFLIFINDQSGMAQIKLGRES